MGKSVSKVVKSVTKSVGKAIKSVVKTPTDALKALSKGDIGGLADAATRAASMGTLSLGDQGVLNANLTNKPKEVSDAAATTPAQTADDGLLNYVADLRARKSRRNRASTNNTGGSSSADTNKLSGTTALGV